MHITCARGFIAARGALQLSVRFDARQRPLSEFARRSGGRDGDASERLKNAKMISPAPPFAPFDETGGKMCASSVSRGTKSSVDGSLWATTADVSTTAYVST